MIESMARRMRFFLIAAVAWVASAGLASFTLAMPAEWWLTRLPWAILAACGFAAAWGLVIAAVGAVVLLTGRSGRPDGYLYDLGRTDAIASPLFALCVAGGIASLAAIHSLAAAGIAGGAVLLLFGWRMGTAMLAGRRLRQVLPPVRDFWPCPALGEGTERLPTRPHREDTEAGAIFAWNEEALHGTRGVLFLADEGASVGEPAPAGRIRTLPHAWRAEDLAAFADDALRS